MSRGKFPTTRWSVVLAAGLSTPESRQAMAWLCEAYWYPLYAFVRRDGHPRDAARDIVQGFYAQFLQGDYPRSLSPDGAPFRVYLRSAMRNYLINLRTREAAAKRGGGIAELPLEIDDEDGERRYMLEPSHTETPDVMFERRWAYELLGLALARVARYFEDRGEGRDFEVLKCFLPGSQSQLSYEEAADRLEMNLGNAKVKIFRVRRRYREFLRQEVAQTLSNPERVDEEIAHLLTVLGGK